MSVASRIAFAGFAAFLAAALPARAQDAAPAEGDAADSAVEKAIAATDAADAGDPWEGFNRDMFKVYLAVDNNLLIPAAKGYRAATPKAGRRGVRRFLANARAPGVFVNDLLQGEIGRAGETLGRFFVNTTIGAGGFADPAAGIGIPAHTEDFGQTLAVWGVSSGPYLFVPVMGPSTVRDGFGAIVQLGLDPLRYVSTPAAVAARWSRLGVSAVSAREQVLDPLAEIEAKSLDYYASLRSFYLQAREREIRNGVTDYSELPDIGEFEELEELQ